MFRFHGEKKTKANVAAAYPKNLKISVSRCFAFSLCTTRIIMPPFINFFLSSRNDFDHNVADTKTWFYEKGVIAEVGMSSLSTNSCGGQIVSNI